MHACGFVCAVGVAFLIVDQFYNGLNWNRLFVGGLVAVAVWTDYERIFRYRVKKLRRFWF